MVTPDRKVRKIMYEYQRTGKVSTASSRADLDPKTGRKYITRLSLFGAKNNFFRGKTNEFSFVYGVLFSKMPCGADL